MSREIDHIDRKILRELQADGRLSNAELSRRVNLSPTPCLERVRRLERDGYIQGYRALLDPHQLGRSVVCFIEVALDRTTPDVFDRFRDAVLDMPEVMECHMITGGLDYLLKVRLADMGEYRRFLGDSLVTLPGVKATHTYVVMEEVKTDNMIPVSEPGGPGRR
ncbi:Lrp/AsnC ligand binding domain-containing protein [Caenispirillum bisanense]|uniref:Lrp/AsnC ligand binding domain-containing protein n=1 Tax=Caenispirillum bisanense TaxID=414052 RepID=UPI0031CEB257